MSMKRETDFKLSYPVYGAFASDGKQLLLLVEAPGLIEARRRVRLVAPLTAVGMTNEVQLVHFEGLPHGVPTFLQAYFDATATDGDETCFHTSNGSVH